MREEDEEARRRKTVRFLKNIEREEKLKNSWSQGESKSGRGEAHAGGSEKGARQRPGRRITGPIARLTRLLQGTRKAVSGWEDDCARLFWFQTDSEEAEVAQTRFLPPSVTYVRRRLQFRWN